MPAQRNRLVAGADEGAGFCHFVGYGFHRQLEKLLPVVTVEPLGRQVDIHKPVRLAIHEQDDIRLHFEQLPVQFLTRTLLLFRLFARTNFARRGIKTALAIELNPPRIDLHRNHLAIAPAMEGFKHLRLVDEGLHPCFQLRSGPLCIPIRHLERRRVFGVATQHLVESRVGLDQFSGLVEHMNAIARGFQQLVVVDSCAGHFRLGLSPLGGFLRRALQQTPHGQIQEAASHQHKGPPLDNLELDAQVGSLTRPAIAAIRRKTKSSTQPSRYKSLRFGAPVGPR
jgi:hypothetical protein